jgi:hypothetical protein
MLLRGFEPVIIAFEGPGPRRSYNQLQHFMGRNSVFKAIGSWSNSHTTFPVGGVVIFISVRLSVLN